MRSIGLLVSLSVGALMSAGLAVAPAMEARDSGKVYAPPLPSGAIMMPAADPRLATALARNGMPDTGFSFTPSDQSRGPAATAASASAVREAARIAIPVERMAVPAPSVAVAPIAYNLGVSAGWKRNAAPAATAPAEVAKVDLVPQSAPREGIDLGGSDRGKRRTALTGTKPIVSTPRLIDTDRDRDLGGAVKLTRNLDVTAGVRYSNERERLPRVNGDDRDSQAVYVGTAFRF